MDRKKNLWCLFVSFGSICLSYTLSNLTVWTHCEKELLSGAQYSFMSFSFHEVGGYTEMKKSQCLVKGTLDKK